MKKLTKKWQLILYGFGGMGVNMLNLIIGSYLCDALMVEGFKENIANWTYFEKTIIVAGVWSVMIAAAKIIDGIIDIPFAAWTDSLKTRWGKRRPAILGGLILMIMSYLAFLNPVSHAESSLANTIYLGVMLCLFYSFYTLTMVTYYATFSEIVDNDADRLVVSNSKTVFDVVYFILGYALIPALIGSMNIRVIALILLPMSLTMLIPLFMIKEKSTLKKDVESRKQEAAEKKLVSDEDETVGLFTSIKFAFRNRSFLIWMAVYFFLQFGLQLFLTGQNVLYSGTMQFEGIKITLVMACAFGPVPFTLIIYNKLVKSRGITAGYIFSVLAYSVAMAVMAACKSTFITNDTARLVVACIGGVISSLGTGCFFSVSYQIPSTIACIEKEKTGVSHPAMYFAVQGLFSGVATAVSTGIVWVNLKDIADGGFVWLMPVLVIAACLISLVIALKLPPEINTIGKKQK